MTLFRSSDNSQAGNRHHQNKESKTISTGSCWPHIQLPVRMSGEKRSDVTLSQPIPGFEFRKNGAARYPTWLASCGRARVGRSTLAPACVRYGTNCRLHSSIVRSGATGWSFRMDVQAPDRLPTTLPDARVMPVNMSQSLLLAVLESDRDWARRGNGDCARPHYPAPN